MAITAAQIKTTVEEFLNLEMSLKGLENALREYHTERESNIAKARKRYEHMLETHKPKKNGYDIHAAAPIISAYDEFHHMEAEREEELSQFHLLAQRLRYFIKALGGHPLYVSFEHDTLDHRAGDHIFYLENDELKSKHFPPLRADETLY